MGMRLRFVSHRPVPKREIVQQFQEQIAPYANHPLCIEHSFAERQGLLCRAVGEEWNCIRYCRMLPLWLLLVEEADRYRAEWNERVLMSMTCVNARVCVCMCL